MSEQPMPDIMKVIEGFVAWLRYRSSLPDKKDISMLAHNVADQAVRIASGSINTNSQQTH